MDVLGGRGWIAGKAGGRDDSALFVSASAEVDEEGSSRSAAVWWFAGSSWSQ
jgi:hypothetical protein